MLERFSCSGPEKSAMGGPVDNCYMRHSSRLSLTTALRCCAVHHIRPILHHIPVQPYGDGTVSLSFHQPVTSQPYAEGRSRIGATKTAPMPFSTLPQGPTDR